MKLALLLEVLLQKRRMLFINHNFSQRTTLVMLTKAHTETILRVKINDFEDEHDRVVDISETTREYYSVRIKLKY